VTIDEMMQEAHENSRAHGFWDAQRDLREGVRGELLFDAVAGTIPEKLMLVVTEAAEAAEAYRDAGLLEELRAVRQYLPLDKPEGFAVELADIIIRTADLAGALGIDLEKAISEKMAYNRSRPYRHGGKRA